MHVRPPNFFNVEVGVNVDADVKMKVKVSLKLRGFCTGGTEGTALSRNMQVLSDKEPEPEPEPEHGKTV